MTGNSGHDKNKKGPQCQNFAITITNISLSLLQKAVHWSGHTNIVFSPVSISAAFTMLSLGTKGNTHKQIFNGLRFNLLKMPEMGIHRCFQHLLQKCLQPNYQIQMITGSSLFIDNRLEVADKFKKMITELYHSETIPTNFRDIQEAKTQINKHTLKRSYGYISEVVEDLPIDTALALVNYFSFEGIQNNNYNDQIIKVEFYLDTGEVLYLSMICRLDKFYLQKDRHLFSWVLMQHYVENSIAFFILPDPEKMQQLLQNLSPEYLNTLQRNMNQRVVNLYFPKFTVSATYDLETVMRTLGITQIFSNNADLSKVTKDAPVKVSKAVHKAVLAIEDTDRKNAQFSNVFKITSPKVPTVKFNRPFLVIIKDKALDLPFIVGKIISIFECQFTKMEDFHLGYRKTIRVLTVNNVDVHHLFRVKGLSSMVLVYTIHQVEERLTYPHFRWMNQQFSLRVVKVHIPELSVSETHDVESMMTLLGITPLFNKEANRTLAVEDTAQESFKRIVQDVAMG
nr:alpha-1-antitrypsin-like protein CM55-MM [Peromyscus maniculatus bairdii]